MTQTEAILDYLKAGHTITPLEALDKFGCFRLGARIWDLVQAGHDIETEIVHQNKKHFARYSLKKSITGIQKSLFDTNKNTAVSEFCA